MAKIPHNQEISIIVFKIITALLSNKIYETKKDILEIPIDGSANKDGWSLVQPLEAVYILLTDWNR